MRKYVQTQGLVNAYHPLYIDLLAEAGFKHYFSTTELHFKGEELDLCNTLSNELKGAFGTRLKAPS